MKLSTYCAFVERRLRTTVTSVLVALITVLSGTFEALAVQGPPALISYQGYLANDGEAVDGENHTLTFRIYASGATTDTTSLWTEEHTVTIDDGYFSVQLGDSINVISSAYDTLADVFADTKDGASRWIGIQVDSDAEITPRLQFLSGSYAFTAQNAVYADVAGAATSIEGDLVTYDSSDNLILNGLGGNTILGANAGSSVLRILSDSWHDETGINGPLRIENSLGSMISIDHNELEASTNGDGVTLSLNQRLGGGVSTYGPLTSEGEFIANAGATITGGLTSQEWAIFDGLVTLSRSSEATLTGSTSGNLLIGSASGDNLVVDSNEIQARNNGAASELVLQEAGGNLEFGNSSSNSQFIVHTASKHHGSILSNVMGDIVIDRKFDESALSLTAGGLEVTQLNSDGATRTGIPLNLNVAGGGAVNIGEGGLDIAGGGIEVAGNTWVDGRLFISSTSSASLNGNGGLGVGPLDGIHLAIDQNEIQAQASPGNAGTLYLNQDGGAVSASGSVIAGSDRRIKRNISYFESGYLESALALKPARFQKTFDQGKTLGPTEIGFIAQDVEEVFPELIFEGEKYLGLSYDGFGVIAIAAIQELKSEKDAEIEALRSELEELRAANSAMKSQIATILEALPNLKTASGQ